MCWEKVRYSFVSVVLYVCVSFFKDDKFWCIASLSDVAFFSLELLSASVLLSFFVSLAFLACFLFYFLLLLGSIILCDPCLFLYFFFSCIASRLVGLSCRLHPSYRIKLATLSELIVLNLVLVQPINTER
jgi:hypothetical protein